MPSAPAPSIEPARPFTLSVTSACVAGAVLLGIGLRLSYYLRGFSLFLDECALALNILARPVTDLHRQLDWDQAAPVGFLYLLEAVVGAGGSSEQVLRFLPLAVSVASVLAFAALGARIFSGWSLVGATVLFAVNQTAISYAAQVKQYSLEVLVSVLMLQVSRPLLTGTVSPRQVVARGLALALLLWFSFSGLFVLAGIGAVLALRSLQRRFAVWHLAGIAAIWGVTLVAVYLVSIRPGMSNDALRGMWVAHYFPVHDLAAAPAWMFDKAAELATLHFNKRLWPLALGAMLTVFLTRRPVDPTLQAGAWGVLACLGAAGVQAYPFSGRLLLFLAPAVVLLIVGGHASLRALAPRAPRLLLDGVAVLALGWCVASAVKTYAVRPTFIDEPREVLRFAASNWRDGDRLFATPYASPCVLYYAPRVGLDTTAIATRVLPVGDASATPRALAPPVGHGRHWLVVMRTPWEARGQSVPVEEYFARSGRELMRRDAQWSSAVLFDVR